MVAAENGDLGLPFYQRVPDVSNNPNVPDPQLRRIIDTPERRLTASTKCNFLTNYNRRYSLMRSGTRLSR